MSFEIDGKVVDFLIEKNNVSYEDRKDVRLTIQLCDGETERPPHEAIFCSIHMHDEEMIGISLTDPEDNYFNKRYYWNIVLIDGRIHISSGRVGEIVKDCKHINITYSKCKISLAS